TAMLSEISAVAGKVHASRAMPVNTDKPGVLPCILVYTDRDPAEKVDDFTTKRSLALRIVVIARMDDAADDVLDDLCEAVEQKMEQALSGELYPEPELARLVESCNITDTALTYTGEEGRADFVHAEMSYTLVYHRTPAQSFPDLNTVALQFDMANPRNDPQSETGPD